MCGTVTGDPKLEERGSHARPCRETELGGEEEGLQMSKVVFVEGRGFKCPQAEKA